MRSNNLTISAQRSFFQALDAQQLIVEFAECPQRYLISLNPERIFQASDLLKSLS